MRLGFDRPRVVVAVLVAAIVVLTLLTPVVVRAVSSGPALAGVEEGATVGADGVRALGVVLPEGEDGSGIELFVDGAPAPTRREGDRLVLADPALPEGKHTVIAREADGVPLLADPETTRTFTVDTTAPALALDPAPATDLRKEFTLRGRAEGATAVLVDDQPVPLDEAGGFAKTMPAAPFRVSVVARDAAGNTAKQEHTVAVRHPGMRAVHMTALAWTSPALREPVLRMAAEGRIDTVQLDIKDESGEIGYQSQVPLAREIGATRGHYDAKAAVDQLHAAGLRVVGRLVAFRDPILARASWESGRTNRVIQTADGRPWSGSYGQYAFTNFADPEVVSYNLDLATEAARLGFDDILYDYIRRPEGAVERMRIPGLQGTPEQAIANFLAKSREAVRAHGAFLGASVFGIAATRPTQVAQDIPAMAAQADYIAPMVYPSHWVAGEYGVAQPESQPYDITARSLGDFVRQTQGTGAQVIPWLQAFTLRKAYGPAKVQAQIAAAKDVGATSFLLWNAGCRYDHAGLQPAA